MCIRDSADTIGQFVNQTSSQSSGTVVETRGCSVVAMIERSCPRGLQAVVPGVLDGHYSSQLRVQIVRIAAGNYGDAGSDTPRREAGASEAQTRRYRPAMQGRREEGSGPGGLLPREGAASGGPFEPAESAPSDEER